jgi:hypothetical protein
MTAQDGDLACCVRCGGPAAVARLGRRADLQAAVGAAARHPAPPGPGRAETPGRHASAPRHGTAAPAGPPQALDGATGPLPVLAGTVLGTRPRLLILDTAAGERRLVLPPATEVWKGQRAGPAALRPGDSTLVRLLPGPGKVADRIWAGLGRVTGVIVHRDPDYVLVEETRIARPRTVLIPGPAAGRLQVRFPRLEPGYLIDVIGLRHPGYLQAVLPATSQPARRADQGPGPAAASRRPVPGQFTGPATWYGTSRPDEPPGARYPALDPDGACEEQRQAIHAQRLPYLSLGSLIGLRNDCTGRAQVLPVTGCAPSSGLFDDRCVTCGTSPRGRVAVLPVATFVALGGEPERGCFNATVSVGAGLAGGP